MGFLDKAKDLLSKNTDKVDTAIDKAGNIIDQKTHGKYADKVHKVQEAAKKAVDKTAPPTTNPPTTNPPTSNPPTTNPPTTNPPTTNPPTTNPPTTNPPT